MTDARKVIPIVAAQTLPPADVEISGCAEAEPYALRVIGDSMAPEFVDGQIVVVDPAMDEQSGAYVIIDYGGDTTLRQIVYHEGRKFLRPVNQSYATVELAGTYRLRGVVVQRTGRRRKDHKHYYGG